MRLVGLSFGELILAVWGSKSIPGTCSRTSERCSPGCVPGWHSMAFGFVIDRMALWIRFEGHDDESLSMLLGGAMIAAGVACQLIGAVRFRAIRQGLLAGRPLVPGLAGPSSWP